MKRITMLVITALLAVMAFGQTVDMTQFSCATITARGAEAMAPDVPYLNEIEKRRYATEINNWKLNRDAGHPGAIPDPPLAYELVVSLETCSAWVKRGAVPVVAKYVEPAPEPPPSIAGAIVPPFAAGRYLCVFKDSAPAGYRITAPDGVLVEKYITLSPFGPMPEYRAVK